MYVSSTNSISMKLMTAMLEHTFIFCLTFEHRPFITHCLMSLTVGIPHMHRQLWKLLEPLLGFFSLDRRQFSSGAHYAKTSIVTFPVRSQLNLIDSWSLSAKHRGLHGPVFVDIQERVQSRSQRFRAVDPPWLAAVVFHRISPGNRHRSTPTTSDNLIGIFPGASG